MTKELDNKIIERLTHVGMNMRQAVPPDFIKAYGSETMVYVHHFGHIIGNTPGLEIDEMIRTAQNENGPHKESVLEALSLVKREMETNKEEFLRWSATSKV